MNDELNPKDMPEAEKKDIPSGENIVLGNPATDKVPRGQIMKQQAAARKAAKALLFEDPPEPKKVTKKKVAKKKVTKKKVAKKAAVKKKPTKK